jgi:hypothetical protein
METKKQNSMYPINNGYKEFRQRCDVNDAFEQWQPETQFSSITEYVKAFAVYFAERVKGGKL